MSLRDLNIELSYADRGSKILNQFLLPAIEQSKRYDRVTSFYTVESLLAISQGIQSLYESNGKMRLIIGVHRFPMEIIDASLQQKYIIDQIRSVRDDIKNGIMSISDSLEKERIATLAWMIQDKLLEVKAAAITGDGIFHPKTLILTDSNGDTIVAVGSPNETGSGLGSNFEQIMVAKSWDSPRAVEVQQDFFEDLWNSDTNGDVITYDITEETADMIVSAIGESYIVNHKPTRTVTQGIIDVSSHMIANYFVSGDIPSLYMHQERAVIDALSRWPVRVLFSDEVGLGKTFEAATTIAFLVKYADAKRVVILTPKSVLQQWQDELMTHFNIDAWLYDSNSKRYVSSGGKEIYIGSKNPLGSRAPSIVLMSTQYARGNKHSGHIFEKEDTILPEVLVVDEAHSARVSEDIQGKKKKTIVYKMLESVSQKIPHLILATATPMQKSSEEYHAILCLLGLSVKWQKVRNYKTSLRLITSVEPPDVSDAYTAGELLRDTIMNMQPSLHKLTDAENSIIEHLSESFENKDTYEISCYVQNNWTTFKPLFVKLHPAHLLTIRNTRRSLTEFGYVFPNRKLHELSIEDSYDIQMFYDAVYQFLSTDCFSVENVLYPENQKNIGFVKVSYQQRIASSLYSCKKSLERRFQKIKEIKDAFSSDNAFSVVYNLTSVLDDFDLDEMTDSDIDEFGAASDKHIDTTSLKRAADIEVAALSTLINRVDRLIKDRGDLKVKSSIMQALEAIENGDQVLLFSRYTDTIDALIKEFNDTDNTFSITYGVYTGNRVEICEHGKTRICTKTDIKNDLFSRKLKVVFCSDAASEGLNLQAARVLINVDVPWTPSRLEQRIGRIARLGQLAKEVDIYNVWYPHSIEERMYHRIQRRLEEANLAIGEFPEVVAVTIKQAVLDNADEDTVGMDILKEIRNSYQVAALEELWHQPDEFISTSQFIRNKLIEICTKEFRIREKVLNDKVYRYEMPNGNIIGLTSLPGMQESISLHSAPWSFVDYQKPNIRIKTTSEGIPCAFSIKVGAETVTIIHEAVFKLLCGEVLDSTDYLVGYPKMLPDFKALDLRKMVDCEIKETPEIWFSSDS